MVEELSGKKAQVVHGPPNPADMLANWADVEKARKLLGWQPQVGLVEGISTLIAWYRQERSWASQIDTD
jgi:nucleoside-diphosphate-sugar epimerase